MFRKMYMPQTCMFEKHVGSQYCLYKTIVDWEQQRVQCLSDKSGLFNCCLSWLTSAQRLVGQL